MSAQKIRHTRSGALLLALLFLSAPALAACSSGSDYCDQLDATRSAWEDLRDTNVIADGTDAFKERFDAFATEVQKLADAARDEFGGDVDTVEASVQQMRDALASLGDLDVAAAADQIGPALDALTSSTDTLLSDVTNACA